MLSWFSVILLFFALVLIALATQLFFIGQERDKLSSQNLALQRTNSELSRVVERDDLTLAHSRRYLAEKVGEMTRTDAHGLLFLDIDDFKSVNDHHGHEVGDELLVAITQALAGACRPGDFVARLGGDEFSVFLKDCDASMAMGAAERFRRAVENASILHNGQKISRTVSIGVTELLPDLSLQDALSLADVALYQAKSDGRNGVRLATKPDDVAEPKHMAAPSLEDVADAMQRGEITYFLQPIFDVHTQRSVGFEALLRWVDRDGRVIPPARFINMMRANYRRNFHPPLEKARKVTDAVNALRSPHFISWNISTEFLQRAENADSDWIEKLFEGSDPNKVVFEIVENAVIEHPESATRLLEKLRNLGVRIALDDFGRGFSNFERLVEFPIDIVKIDRSFVSQLETDADQGIIAALVALQKSMGFDIIAEGVETHAQLDALKKLGIKHAQGFLLGRPAPVEYWCDQIS